MKKALKIIGNVIALLALVPVGIKLYRADLDYSLIFSSPRVVLAFIGCIFISLAAVVLLSFVWTNTVRFFAGSSCSRTRGMCVYCRANLAKYIPGNVFQYVERNLFLADSGLDQLELALSSVLEIAGLLLAGLILGTVFGFRDIAALVGRLSTGTLLIAGIAIAAVIAAAVVFLIRSVKFRTAVKRLLSLRFLGVFLINLVLCAAALLILGSVLLILTAMLSPDALSAGDCLTVMSAQIISWLAGYVVVGAPAGIGVKELVVSLIVRGSLTDIVLLAAVVQRVASIFGDVLAFAAASLFSYVKKLRE